LYRNFHFVYADQEIVDIKIPLPPPVPLRRGIKGEDRGCKLVLVKTGITVGKTQPPDSPFSKGD